MPAEINFDESVLTDEYDWCRVNYFEDGFCEEAAKVLRVDVGEVERRWTQLMFFFTTVHYLIRTDGYLPRPGCLPMPRKLESVWIVLCSLRPGAARDYILVCFNSWTELLWRENGSCQSILTEDELVFIMTTAQVLGFDVIEELWVAGTISC